MARFATSIRYLLTGLVIIFNAVCVILVLAQNLDPELGVDQMFEVARAKAFAGEYAEARAIAYEILQSVPGYHDVRILVARTYAWEGERDKDREALAYVLERDPEYRDALSAPIDVERWDGRYARGLELAEQALEYYPDDTEFLLKKAEILARLNRYDEAQAVLRQAGDIAPDDADIARLRQSLDTWRPRLNRIWGRDSRQRIFRIFRARSYRLSSIRP